MTVALRSQVCTLVISTLFLYILSGFLVSGLMGVECVLFYKLNRFTKMNINYFS